MFVARLRLLALLVLIGAVGCGGGDEAQGPVEGGGPILADGRGFEMAGIQYRVVKARQLNPYIAPDTQYYQGPAPVGDEILFGVFLEACNEDGEPQPVSEDLVIVDSQNHVYRPLDLPASNVYAYKPQRLEENRCVPREGTPPSRADGAVLVYEVPQNALQLRPWALVVSPPPGAGEDVRPTRVNLDL